MVSMVMTIVPPVEISKVKDTTIPERTEKREITSAITSVVRKFFRNKRAVTGGMTMSAEIKSTPTIGIASETVSAESAMSAKLIFWMGTPAARALSSSKEV